MSRDLALRGAEALRHRGPDCRAAVKRGAVALGHARLAILDLDERSNQPFTYGATTLVFAGEIWNYQELRQVLEEEGLTFKTRGDVEVLGAMLDEHGERALPMLQGMFAVAWTTDGRTLWLARDRFGETPLHYSWNARDELTFASELKGLAAMGADLTRVADVPPGGLVRSPMGLLPEVSTWYDAPIRSDELERDREDAASDLRAALTEGVRERCIADVPVAALLSGGIDSSAVAMLAKARLPSLVAFTAVYDPKSRDLRRAREAASYVGIPLVEVPVPAPRLEDVRRVIKAIEMPFKAQVEIGWPCLLLADAIRGEGFKVVLSGEGSDELWASYGFAYHALKAGADWHEYRKRLFVGQHRKNFARCNKAFLTRGVECRLPFLSTGLVELALSLPRDVVVSKGRPKAVLQEAFRGLLPDAIVDRPKVAFQDGLGIKGKFEEVAAPWGGPKALYRKCLQEDVVGATLPASLFDV